MQLIAVDARKENATVKLTWKFEREPMQNPSPSLDQFKVHVQPIPQCGNTRPDMYPVEPCYQHKNLTLDLGKSYTLKVAAHYGGAKKDSEEKSYTVPTMDEGLSANYSCILTLYFMKAFLLQGSTKYKIDRHDHNFNALL